MDAPPLRDEARTLVRLSLPVAAAQVGTMMMGMVDTAMVGRVSVDALAAASIGILMRRNKRLHEASGVNVDTFVQGEAPACGAGMHAGD